MPKHISLFASGVFSTEKRKVCDAFAVGGMRDSAIPSGLSRGAEPAVVNSKKSFGVERILAKTPWPPERALEIVLKKFRLLWRKLQILSLFSVINDFQFHDCDYVGDAEYGCQT